MEVIWDLIGQIAISSVISLWAVSVVFTGCFTAIFIAWRLICRELKDEFENEEEEERKLKFMKESGSNG